MEEATVMVLKLFRAMDDGEKRETILALGEEIESTGLVNRLVPEREEGARSAPRRRASGKKAKKPYWLRHAIGFDGSQKGVMQIEGEWLSEPDLSGFSQGEYVILGFRWPKKTYHLLRVVRDETALVSGGPDGTLEVKDGMELHEGGFNQVMESLQEHLG
jgi:hypothetical protein